MVDEGKNKKARTISKKDTVKKDKPKKTIRKKKVSIEGVQKLRIRISAYENKILDKSVKQIMDTAIRYDARVRGPVPIPTSIKKYTVNRGAFVHKDAREQFEMRTHKRLIDIENPSPKIVESLTNLDLPSGVKIDVKMS